MEEEEGKRGRGGKGRKGEEGCLGQVCTNKMQNAFFPGNVALYIYMYIYYICRSSTEKNCTLYNYGKRCDTAMYSKQ